MPSSPDATQTDTSAGQIDTSAGLIRRLAAMFYDGLISVALALVLTGAYTLISVKIIGAEAYKQQAAANPGAFDPLLASILFISLYLFFAYFWRHNGQTLGMQAWHLRVENQDGSRISWMQALLRYLMGWMSWLTLGAGYLWILVDRDRKSWTDRFSYSLIIKVPSRRKP
jgi:uncharacterized RDD family membrane protein YckC